MLSTSSAATTQSFALGTTGAWAACVENFLPTPGNTEAPSISGTAAQGDTLTVTKGAWTPSGSTISDQWQDCNSSGGSCTDISGATGTSHVVQSPDVGDTIRVSETATDSDGTSSPVQYSP